MSELALHRRVVGLLRAYGARRVVWWHTPNGEKRDRRTAARLASMGVLPGVPDIVLVIQGKAYGLELKAGKGRLSAEQHAFTAAAADAGMTVHVARDLDEAIATLNLIGAFSMRVTLTDARDGAEGAGEGASQGAPSPNHSPRRAEVPV